MRDRSVISIGLWIALEFRLSIFGLSGKYLYYVLMERLQPPSLVLLLPFVGMQHICVSHVTLVRPSRKNKGASLHHESRHRSIWLTASVGGGLLSATMTTMITRAGWLTQATLLSATRPKNAGVCALRQSLHWTVSIQWFDHILFRNWLNYSKDSGIGIT